MPKLWAVLGSLVFLVLAPGTFAGLIPWWIGRWRFQAMPAGFGFIRIVGALLFAAGLVFLLDSFARFALQGLGTPAPIAPPSRLVVTGYYRYVRNPMYVAVLAIILGQALLLANIALLAYAAIVWAAFYAFVLGYEEPTLRHLFGEDYKTFCAHVPRWLPRLKPWAPPTRIRN